MEVTLDSSHTPHRIHKQFQGKPLSEHSSFLPNHSSRSPLEPPAPGPILSHSWLRGNCFPTCTTALYSPFSTQQPRRACENMSQLASFLYSKPSPCSVSLGVKDKDRASSSGSRFPSILAPSMLLPCSASASEVWAYSYLFIMFLVCLDYKSLEDKNFCPFCPLLYAHPVSRTVSGTSRSSTIC